MRNTGSLDVESPLVLLCIEAATESYETIEKWRRQRRTLERLPTQLAESLLHRLLRRRLLSPSLLEVFQHRIEEIDLRGEKSVDAEWMAYLGAFSCLRSLNVADCHRLTSSALWAITGMTSLKELDLSRCSKVNDAGMMHLLSIPTLEKLFISETSVSADGVTLLSSLNNLSSLDLGGLPVTDQALYSLQGLKQLQYLVIWGSKISNKGAAILKMFPKLEFLDVAWTNVTKLPNLPFLACLSMSHCTVHCISEGAGLTNAPLSKLIFSGATFIDVTAVFLSINTSSVSSLDLSRSYFHSFTFLHDMKTLEHLDLSFTKIGDESVELIACTGVNLRSLNLSNTVISSAGVGILAGHVPNLEVILLSETHIDDVALSYLSMMPALRVINLSNTNVKGQNLSLTALQSLNHLERLDLQETRVSDESLYPLSSFQELNYLFLKSLHLTDISSHHLSRFPRLMNLSVRDAVLTNGWLHSFKPRAVLKLLDLRGCWLLTEDAIFGFHIKYPQVELLHELLVPPEEQPSSRVNSRGPDRIQKGRRMPKSSTSFKDYIFIDQRLKYSRDELLALQHSPLSLASLHDRDNFPHLLD